MVEFKYNNMMERYDIELPYQLGDLKEMVCVASIEDDTITFWKPLNISDVRSIILHYDELKFQLSRNPLEDLDKKILKEVKTITDTFVLEPDGVDNE